MIDLDFLSSSSSDKAGLEAVATTATGAGVSRLTKHILTSVNCNKQRKQKKKGQNGTQKKE